MLEQFLHARLLRLQILERLHQRVGDTLKSDLSLPELTAGHEVRIIRLIDTVLIVGVSTGEGASRHGHFNLAFGRSLKFLAAMDLASETEGHRTQGSGEIPTSESRFPIRCPILHVELDPIDRKFAIHN